MSIKKIFFYFNFRGAHANKACIFPFSDIFLDNIKHYGCVVIPGLNELTGLNDTLCPTGFTGNYWGNWSYCGSDCPTHDEVLAQAWKTDETIKMTLQYNNSPILWAGLELYGNLLSCFLLYSLILAVLISAMGNI